jgi:hypothetical protein
MLSSQYTRKSFHRLTEEASWFLREGSGRSKEQIRSLFLALRLFKRNMLGSVETKEISTKDTCLLLSQRILQVQNLGFEAKHFYAEQGFEYVGELFLWRKIWKGKGDLAKILSDTREMLYESGLPFRLNLEHIKWEPPYTKKVREFLLSPIHTLIKDGECNGCGSVGYLLHSYQNHKGIMKFWWGKQYIPAIQAHPLVRPCMFIPVHYRKKPDLQIV